MNSKKALFGLPINRVWVLLAMIAIAGIFALYAANIIRWRNSPDFGWRTTYESGPNVVAQVFDRAKTAGLRINDTIVAINGKTYKTFDELYFKIRNNEPGSVNT